MAELLHAKPNTYGNWLKAGAIPLGGTLSPENEVVIAFIAIYRSLAALFSNPKDQLIWLSQPHPDLRSVSPMDFSKQSTANLFWLRSYLDYVRGRGA